MIVQTGRGRVDVLPTRVAAIGRGGFLRKRVADASGSSSATPIVPSAVADGLTLGSTLTTAEGAGEGVIRLEVLPGCTYGSSPALGIRLTIIQISATNHSAEATEIPARISMSNRPRRHKR